MSLFDDASLVLTPNGYKASKLYSIKPTSGLGDMTVVRATTARRVNSAGLIESVATNVPRLDYPPLGGCPSILVEPQRTNNVLYSEEFDNASWTKVGSTISANSTTAPNGTTTADKLIEGTLLGNHYINRNITNSNSLFSFSVFAKKSERNFLYLNAFATVPNNFTYVPSAYFNLDNGTVGTVSSATATIQDYGNGWYRCTLNCTSIFSQLSASVGIYIMTATANGVSSYLGDGTSGIFIWGAQAEAGSNATSYIPTVASSVTRNADVISKTGISSLINSEEGVLFFKISNLQQTVNTANWITLSDSTTNATNYLGLRFDTDGTINYRIIVGGVMQASITTAAVNQSLSRKIAIKWKVNNFSLYIDGLEIGSDLSGSVFPLNTLSALRFNFNGTSNSFFGKLENLIVYPTALTDAQLATLTTL